MGYSHCLPGVGKLGLERLGTSGGVFWTNMSYIWLLVHRGGCQMIATRFRKAVQTSVMLQKDLYVRVQRVAAASEVLVAWVIRHAVQRFLDNHQYQRELLYEVPEEKPEQAER